MKSLSLTLVLSLVVSGPLSAGDLGPDKAKLEKSRQRGVEFLKNAQLEDGAWVESQQAGTPRCASMACFPRG